MRAEISSGAWLQIALLTAAFIACFWNFLANQARYSLEPDWSHAYVVPLVSLYYIYENRKSILAIPAMVNWFGLPMLIAGILWYFCFSLLEAYINHTKQGMGVMLSVLGIVLFMTGWRLWKALLFPQLYLGLGITLPPPLLMLVTPTLQRWAAEGAFFLLTILGFEGDIEGNIITLQKGGVPIPLNVAEACSGMRMIVAFIALGVAVAAFTCPKWWQRITLVALALPVAVFVNILRVATIGFMSTIDRAWSGGDAHMFLGLIWLLPAVFMYMGIAWILRHLVIEDSAAAGVTVQAAGSQQRANGVTA